MAKYATDSRYALDSSGMHADRRTTGRVQFTTYICKQSETLEFIAASVLGDFRRYWEIADLNPQVKFPLDIDTGTVLRIPL